MSLGGVSCRASHSTAAASCSRPSPASAWPCRSSTLLRVAASLPAEHAGRPRWGWSSQTWILENGGAWQGTPCHANYPACTVPPAHYPCSWQCPCLSHATPGRPHTPSLIHLVPGPQPARNAAGTPPSAAGQAGSWPGPGGRRWPPGAARQGPPPVRRHLPTGSVPKAVTVLQCCALQTGMEQPTRQSVHSSGRSQVHQEAAQGLAVGNTHPGAPAPARTWSRPLPGRR